MTANARNGLATAYDLWENHEQTKPVQILVLNLMPTKVTTERQFLEQFDHLSDDVELSFLYPTSHHFKGTSPTLIRKHYFDLSQVADRYFDGLIITGAPVEKLPFTQVDYWLEFCQILRWSRQHVSETLFECWAAQAGLFIDFTLTKHLLAGKLFGVYTSSIVNRKSRLVRDLGAGGLIKMPQSRHSASNIDRNHLPGDLQIVVDSKEAGPMIMYSRHFHHTYITGHPEYGRDTLANEYERDQKKQLAIHAPRNYFTDVATRQVDYSWGPTSHLIYQNWLNILTDEHD